MSQDQTSIGAFRQQFGFLIGRMAQLRAAFADFAVLARAGDTSCGSSSDRRPRRAGWRRFRPAPDRRNVAHAAGPAPPAVAERSAPGWAVARGGRPPPVRPDRARRRARWRAKPPARHRPRQSCRWPAHGHDGLGQGSPSLGANGMPSSSATFFWTSMIASARARRRVRRRILPLTDAFAARAGWARRFSDRA